MSGVPDPLPEDGPRQAGDRHDQRRTTLRLQAVPADQVPHERGTRRMVVVGMLALLALLAWAAVRSPARVEDQLRWSDIAPPEATPIHPWRWIVIHHSASRRGDSQEIDHEHQAIRGWDGIGYDFVIGNGTDMPLGRIDATFRWRLQTRGAHAGPGPEQAIYNQDGIGICLIGNFETGPVDAFQEHRLVELCAQLIHHIPTLSVSRIIGHRDVPGKITVCPGANLDLERIRFLVRAELLARGLTVR